MSNDFAGNLYAYILKKCEINGLNIEKVRKAAGISHVNLLNWKTKTPKTLRLVGDLLKTIERQAAELRADFGRDDVLFAGNLIRSYSGIYVNVFDPTPDMFPVEDIAEGLAYNYRWGGHTKIKITVAEHSVRVAKLSRNKIAALFHDASESYLADIKSPIKRALPEYKYLEDLVMTAIGERYGFSWPVPDDVKYNDAAELEREWRDAVINFGEPALSPEDAKHLFLNYYKALTSGNTAV